MFFGMLAMYEQLQIVEKTTTSTQQRFVLYV